MKRFLRLCLAAAPLLAAGILAGHAAPARADTITVGLDDESYPPFFSKNADGKWVGWELDLLSAVCDKMGATCKTKEIAWDGLIPSLQQKQIDIIWASMTINGERRKVIDFSHFYYNTQTVMIGDKEDKTPVDCGHLASFKDHVIGVEAGTNFATYLKDAPVGMQVKSYTTMDNVLSDLTSGRIDYALEGRSTFAVFLSKNPDFAVKTVCPDNDVLGYGVGAGVRKGDTALRDRISAAIMAVVQDGTWDKITARYPSLKGVLIKP